MGRVESIYAGLAHSIHTKTDIRTAKALAERMAPNIANDKDFETAFATAYVSKSKLARYYLATLERTAGGKALSELVLNEDTKAVNLEHILPVNPPSDETGDVDDAAGYASRIGNLVLLNARGNSAAGNAAFDAKRPVFAASAFMLTKEVAAYAEWGPSEIDDRQLKLAKLAAKTWSMKWRSHAEWRARYSNLRGGSLNVPQHVAAKGRLTLQRRGASFVWHFGTIASLRRVTS